MRVGLGLRPTWPYWARHPYASGPSMFQPDLLHQLWKGVYLNHLVPWWTKLLGKEELDRRFIGLPRYSGDRYFPSGISQLTQWTGNEARATARVFLPLIAGDIPRKAVRAARCVIDFMYRARLPQLDEDDLGRLESDLEEFHEFKNIFRARGVHTSIYGFNGIAKLHTVRHYPHQTREMGSPDGYSTEGPERLHIDCVKVPYRASNGVNPEPQMLIDLQRREAWIQRRADLEREGVIPRRQRRRRPEEELIEDEDSEDSDGELDSVSNGEGSEDGDGDSVHVKEDEVYQPAPAIRIAKRPAITNITGAAIVSDYHAPGFVEAVVDYVHVHSRHLAWLIDEHARFGVYPRFTLIHPRLPFAPLVGYKVDLVRAAPARHTMDGRNRPPTFDTVLLEERSDRIGLHRYRVARVLVIFQLPQFCRELCTQPLAYVEMFADFNPVASNMHHLVVTKPLRRGGVRVRKIVPLSYIRMSCQLVPDYSTYRPDRVTPLTDVLSTAERFFLNRHRSYYFWSLMDHWRRVMQD
ncbi:hypothetical protein FS749_001534 [Ceratobasidium sp. UAMH 11750]|nr:hypothetical protein FS749_001534 [Ceratobasidium sp. UAMH 11750]